MSALRHKPKLACGPIADVRFCAPSRTLARLIGDPKSRHCSADRSLSYHRRPVATGWSHRPRLAGSARAGSVQENKREKRICSKAWLAPQRDPPRFPFHVPVQSRAGASRDVDRGDHQQGSAPVSHSRLLLMRAYPYEAQEIVFDAHAQAFRFFGDASP